MKMNKYTKKKPVSVDMKELTRRMREEEPVALKLLLLPSFWMGSLGLFGIWFVLSFVLGVIGNNVPFFFWKFIFGS